MSRKKKAEKNRIKKKRRRELPCGLCLLYWQSTYRKNGIRHCRAVNTDVSAIEEPCNQFELSQFFYCDKLNFQSSCDICIARIKKADNHFECKKCKLGWQIFLYCEPSKLEFNFKGE